MRTVFILNQSYYHKQQGKIYQIYSTYIIESKIINYLQIQDLRYLYMILVISKTNIADIASFR